MGVCFHILLLLYVTYSLRADLFKDDQFVWEYTQRYALMRNTVMSKANLWKLVWDLYNTLAPVALRHKREKKNPNPSKFAIPSLCDER